MTMERASFWWAASKAFAMVFDALGDGYGIGTVPPFAPGVSSYFGH